MTNGLSKQKVIAQEKRLARKIAKLLVQEQDTVHVIVMYRVFDRESVEYAFDSQDAVCFTTMFQKFTEHSHHIVTEITSCDDANHKAYSFLF